MCVCVCVCVCLLLFFYRHIPVAMSLLFLMLLVSGLSVWALVAMSLLFLMLLVAGLSVWALVLGSLMSGLKRAFKYRFRACSFFSPRLNQLFCLPRCLWQRCVDSVWWLCSQALQAGYFKGACGQAGFESQRPCRCTSCNRVFPKTEQ